MNDNQKSRNSKKILITVGAYLPGYKYGGPLRSIANLLEGLGGKADFYILTNDRDLGDTKPYEGVEANTWIDRGNARVWYATTKWLQEVDMERWVTEAQFDTIYLNGIWEVFTRRFLQLRVKCTSLTKVKFILAPRGALGDGAISIKPFKKILYLKVSKLLHAYKGVIFHSTCIEETNDIIKLIGEGSRIRTIPNPPAPVANNFHFSKPKTTEASNWVFISRISPKKNLHWLLSALRKYPKKACLHIIGPFEDEKYRTEVMALEKELPEWIQVIWHGPLNPTKIKKVLPSYDLFILPTLNENYGHVIIEAWSAGIPVLISQNTPWRDLEKSGLGWDIPLSEDLWLEALSKFSNLSFTDRANQAEKCHSFALDLYKSLKWSDYCSLFDIKE